MFVSNYKQLFYTGQTFLTFYWFSENNCL